MNDAKKVALPADKHVGSRIRGRRMMLGMSQEKLGNAVELTFQQIQKYEKGTNRVGSSRLAEIANVLGVPPAYFFEGLDLETTRPAGSEVNLSNDFMAATYGARLARAFLGMSPKARASLVELVEQLAVETPAARAVKKIAA